MHWYQTWPKPKPTAFGQCAGQEGYFAAHIQVPGAASSGNDIHHWKLFAALSCNFMPKCLACKYLESQARWIVKQTQAALFRGSSLQRQSYHQEFQWWGRRDWGGQCWFTTPGTHHGLTGSWCSMNSCRALPHLFSLAFCVLTVEKCRRRCPNIQVLLLRLGCLSFWQKQPAVQETMTDDKGTCHFELPENTRTPVCLVLHLCVVRTISMNKPVKYLAQGYPGQKCFIQEKEPSLTIFCLLDNIR